jgi:hypothetical protein
MTDNKQKAIEWAKDQIANKTLVGPIKLNEWEIIQEPIKFLESHIARLESGSLRDQYMCYIRLKTLKSKI